MRWEGHVSRRAVGHSRNFLDRAIDLSRVNPGQRDMRVDAALIARALGIRPEYINGQEYYTIPPRSYARDEYPFSTTEEGGPINWNNDRVSVDVVTAEESSLQGELLGYFYLDPRVGLVPGNPNLSKFGVLASPVNNYNSGYIRRDGTKRLL